jgi:hypothetical protein
MTPPAASSAARAVPAAPFAPRRRPVAPPRPPVRRRVSGPLRAPARGAPARRVATEGGGLLLGALGMLERLSSHRMLDRLIRGRLWIGIVAFALIGIVTLQLGLLKLNSGIGRTLEKESTLQRANAALSIENSELAGGGRVESQAGQIGMRLTAVGGLKFHESHASSDVPRATAALKEATKPAEPVAEAGSAPAQSETETASSASGPASSSEGAGSSSETSSGEATGNGATESPSSASHSGGESSEREPPAAAATGESSAEAGGGTAAPGG